MAQISSRSILWIIALMACVLFSWGCGESDKLDTDNDSSWSIGDDATSPDTSDDNDTTPDLSSDDSNADSPVTDPASDVSNDGSGTPPTPSEGDAPTPAGPTQPDNDSEGEPDEDETPSENNGDGETDAEEPTEPEDPVDPIEPDEPTDPVIPDDPGNMPKTCTEIVECFMDCGDGWDCWMTCPSGAPQESQDKATSMILCFTINCQADDFSDECLETHCESEMIACMEDGQ